MSDPLFDLSGRIAVVTGGMGQLGLVYATGLAERGVRVASFDIAVGTTPDGVRAYDGRHHRSRGHRGRFG